MILKTASKILVIKLKNTSTNKLEEAKPSLDILNTG